MEAEPGPLDQDPAVRDGSKEGGGSVWGRGLWAELRLGANFDRSDSRFYIDMQVALQRIYSNYRTQESRFCC